MKEKTIYALGFFDGVHIGHQALLHACRELAQSMAIEAGVVTFTTHPDGLVSGNAPLLINTAGDRRRLLKDYGIQTVVELTFDQALMNMPWQEFFALLQEKYGAAGFVCGEDFRFGKGGEGTAEVLKKACLEKGMPCTVIPQQKIGAVAVSSTHIRRLLEEGDMEKAVEFLGHRHVISGQVVSGRKLGRTLGVPTANLHLPENLVCPKFGVYAGVAEVKGETYLAVTNIGTRPTVGGHHVTVEAWLLDFEGELYGETLTLSLSNFLRPEKKFANVAALQGEIQKNALQTRELLGK